MRLRHKPWLKEKIKEFYDNLLVEEATSYKGKWRTIFNNDNPLKVEVGTGKGNFITTLADLHPDTNYIGCEMQEAVIYYAVKKAYDKELTNMLFLNRDMNFITDFFAPGEIDTIYLNFSDPWPKVRHAKRRLTHRNFLDKYRQVLKPEGTIQFKTDNKDLFEFSVEEFQEAGWKLLHVTRDLHNSEKAEGNVMTEYEAKFSKKGISICFLEAKMM